MLDGQRVRFEHLIAIQIRDRHFGCGNQPVIRAFQLEKIAGEFRQITGADTDWRSSRQTAA